MYLLIITLNVSGLNIPIKRHGVAEWKTRPTYKLSMRDPLNIRYTQTGSKRVEKDIMEMETNTHTQKPGEQYLHQTN